jgi:predicted enzyme related to lactoylglutathione lyase
MPHLAVADCDAKARALGARLSVPPTDIPEVGRFAELIDAQVACITFMKPQD